MKNYQKGGSNLLLVLVIGMILMLLSTATLLYTYLSTKISTQQVNSLQAEYAAEGILLDTYRLISSNQFNKTYPFEEVFTLNDGTVIYRQVELVDGQYTITVTAQTGGSSRSFLGKINATGEVIDKYLDIVLIIDHSSSMSNDEIFDANAKANEFAQSIMSHENINAQVGVIKFSKTVYPTFPQRYLSLTNNALAVERILIDPSFQWLTDRQGTNIARSLKKAEEMFIAFGRPEAQKVVVFFSDGAANQGDNYSESVCDSGYCVSPNETGFEPLNHGYVCTQEILDYANDLKALNTKIYAISYTKNFNNTEDRCKTAAWWGNEETALEKTKQLARMTLLLSTSETPQPTDINYVFENNLTHYKEADNLEDVDEIFGSITENIITDLEFQYTSTDPQPIPNL